MCFFCLLEALPSLQPILNTFLTFLAENLQLSNSFRESKILFLNTLVDVAALGLITLQHII